MSNQKNFNSEFSSTLISHHLSKKKAIQELSIQSSYQLW
jgi:hypothetical protein